MIIQQELTDKCTPEIIKKMCELAEGFRCDDNTIYSGSRNIMTDFTELFDTTNFFPLLIHRAVEGFNTKEYGKKVIVIEDDYVIFWSEDLDECRVYNFKNYQPTTLTHAECVMLHCLLEAL